MIELNIKFDKKEYITVEKLKVSLMFRSFYKRLLLYLILSIVFILMASTEKARYALTIIASILVGITFSYILIMMSTHKVYFKKITALADKYEKEKMDYKFQFSDEGIAYEDPQKAMQYKWRVFDSYSFYKNYLLIYRDSDIIYVLNKMDSPDFTSIQDLIKSKLILKK